MVRDTAYPSPHHPAPADTTPRGTSLEPAPSVLSLHIWGLKTTINPKYNTRWDSLGPLIGGETRRPSEEVRGPVAKGVRPRCVCRGCRGEPNLLRGSGMKELKGWIGRDEPRHTVDPGCEGAVRGNVHRQSRRSSAVVARSRGGALSTDRAAVGQWRQCCRNESHDDTAADGAKPSHFECGRCFVRSARARGRPN